MSLELSESEPTADEARKARKAIRRRERYLLNREFHLEKWKVWRKQNPLTEEQKEAARQRTREWYKNNRNRALQSKKARNAVPEVRLRRRNNAHLKLYGITLKQRADLFKAQGCKCAICGSSESGRRWELDHCHETGAVRGILCSGCNLLLGHGRDNPNTLMAAAAYLGRGGFENVARIIKR